jgi:hypothetical protein
VWKVEREECEECEQCGPYPPKDAFWGDAEIEGIWGEFFFGGRKSKVLLFV